MNEMNVQIYEQELNDDGKLAIIIGGLNSDKPKEYLDKVVEKYVSGKTYNEFIDSHLNNPWIRVVITGIND